MPFAANFNYSTAFSSHFDSNHFRLTGECRKLRQLSAGPKNLRNGFQLTNVKVWAVHNQFLMILKRLPQHRFLCALY